MKTIFYSKNPAHGWIPLLAFGLCLATLVCLLNVQVEGRRSYEMIEDFDDGSIPIVNTRRSMPIVGKRFIGLIDWWLIPGIWNVIRGVIQTVLNLPAGLCLPGFTNPQERWCNEDGNTWLQYSADLSFAWRHKIGSMPMVPEGIERPPGEDPEYVPSPPPPGEIKTDRRRRRSGRRWSYGY